MPVFLRCIMPVFLAALALGPLAAAEETEQQLNVRLLEFSKQKDEARTRKMVEEGANVNSRTRRGETPLVLWVKAGNAGMVDGHRSIISPHDVCHAETASFQLCIISAGSKPGSQPVPTSPVPKRPGP